jgi:hypothetical protein
MPYVEQDIREFLDETIDGLAEDARSISSPGNWRGVMNYIISRLAVGIVMNHPDGVRYATLSDMHAAMNDAAAEWYRRVMGPYEDSAAEKNGDVYDEIVTPALGSSVSGNELGEIRLKEELEGCCGECACGKTVIVDEEAQFFKGRKAEAINQFLKHVDTAMDQADASNTDEVRGFAEYMNEINKAMMRLELATNGYEVWDAWTDVFQEDECPFNEDGDWIEE